jgi:hypothetical protein
LVKVPSPLLRNNRFPPGEKIHDETNRSRSPSRSMSPKAAPMPSTTLETVATPAWAATSTNRQFPLASGPWLRYSTLRPTPIDPGASP